MVAERLLLLGSHPRPADSYILRPSMAWQGDPNGTGKSLSLLVYLVPISYVAVRHRRISPFLRTSVRYGGVLSDASRSSR